MSSPSGVSPPPPSPETSTQPPKASTNAATRLSVSRSLKNSTDISVTHIGEVYSRIAAMDSGSISIDLK